MDRTETKVNLHVSSGLWSISHMKIIIKIGAMFIHYVLSCTSLLHLQTLDGCHLYARFMVGYGRIEGRDMRIGVTIKSKFFSI
jgi:hypothetical protein